MMVAVEEAEKRGIPFSLCDRDVQVTLRRAWGKAGLISKGKLLGALLGSVFEEEKITEEDLKKLKEESSMTDMMGQVAQYLPEIKDVLIDERDVYLAEKIRSCPGKKIFAVVGAGHLPGIRKHLQSGIHADLAPIEQLPKKGKLGTVLKWLFPVAIFGLFGYGIFKMGWQGFLDMALIWALVTGGASALGALVTLGHPLTILISFLTAPFTTIHPLIGVAMYSGWSEAMLRKPRVSDFEKLNEDLLTVRGFFKNRVTHILIVALGSSIGATLGMVFGVPAITALVGGG
jgi:pheromone shutdown-related protein TraB